MTQSDLSDVGQGADSKLGESRLAQAPDEVPGNGSILATLRQLVDEWLLRISRSSVAARISSGLLVVQSLLLINSIPWNSVTFDEVQHLPAGISYWQHGRFFSYHHNPPVTKLFFATPAVITGVPVNYRNYFYQPASRHSDFLFGKDFMESNRANYQSVYVRCRLISAAFTVLGGWIIFRWGRELIGNRAALLSQTLWTFSPMVLAHGGLVTPDIGATVIGFGATYLFWKYLRDPRPARVVVSAMALGFAVGSKFTLVVLPAIWAVLALLAFWRRGAEEVKTWTLRLFCLDAVVMTFVALITLNTVYLYEGSGMPLGRLKVFSNALTKPVDPADPDSERTNRFDDEVWKWIPTPLPQHFVLGIDHQMFDTRAGDVYLGGTWRHGEGWWYYYLYAFAVKTPVGTLALISLGFLSVGSLTLPSVRARALASRPASSNGTRAPMPRRLDLLDLATLLLPTLVVLAMLSANTVLNKHSRYMLQVYPFIFLLLGPVAHAGVGRLASVRRWIVTACLTLNVVSVLFVHPFYLTYFNEPSGGSSRGYKHLIDSNIDWGQGLVALRRWLDGNSIETPLQLAYFGAVNPSVYEIEFEVPGVLGQSSLGGPRPGLHVISVNYVAGSEFSPLDMHGARRSISENGYRFYQQLEPTTTIANCFNVYDVTEEQVNRLREEAGLPRWSDDVGVTN